MEKIERDTQCEKREESEGSDFVVKETFNEGAERADKGASTLSSVARTDER